MRRTIESPHVRTISALLAVTLGTAACGEPTSHQSAPTLPGESVTTTQHAEGYDISWAQCGKPLPKQGEFGIVQITGGIANVMSPIACFKEQARWANTLTGTTTQPKLQFYIWPANPGSVYQGKHIADWPTHGNNQFGACRGSDGPACSYQYGLEHGRADIGYAQKTLGNRHLGNVFVDVESGVGNDPGTWQTNGRNNVAAIEGFAAAIRSSGNTPGLYSNSHQLELVTGDASTTSLAVLPEWTTGAETQQDAQQDCQHPFIEGGHVVLAQYVQGLPVASPIDYDHGC